MKNNSSEVRKNHHTEGSVRAMKITNKHKGVASVDRWDRMIEDGLFALADRVRVEAARAVIERRWDGHVPYRAGLHIVTPGPNITVDGVDHTIQDAIAKMLRALDTAARRRFHRRRQRVKSNLAAPSINRQQTRRKLDGARRSL
jgi:hypothetical protein